MPLAAVAVVIAGMHLAQAVLIPLLLAVLLAFVLAPVASWLQRTGLRRLPSVMLVILLLFALTGCIGWLVAGQLGELGEHAEEYRANLRGKFAALRDAMTGPLERASETVRELGQDILGPEPAPDDTERVRLAEPAADQLPWVQEALSKLVDLLLLAGLVLLLAMVMLLRREDLRDRVLRLAGGRGLHVTTQALGDASQRISRYLFTQTLINVLHGTVVWLGLTLVGVPLAPLWGLLSALLRFIPYAGPLIGALLPITVSLAASPGWQLSALTITFFVVLELLNNNLLEPWLYGARTGVSPLAIILAAVFFAWLWGPVGLVLSTPLTVCLVVASRHVPQLGFLGIVLGDEPALEPPARLYHRLLADDLDEAWEQVLPVLSAGGLPEVGDELLIPALSLAEQDRRAGGFDALTRANLRDGVQALLAQMEERLPPAAEPSGLRVVVLPAHDEADQLAARLLALMLVREGAQVELAGTATLVSEMIELVARTRADTVFVSMVPPAGFTHARYLCKRLRARFPDLSIILGLWMMHTAEAQARDRLQVEGDLRIVSTLAEARVLLQQQALLARSAAAG